MITVTNIKLLSDISLNIKIYDDDVPSIAIKKIIAILKTFIDLSKSTFDIVLEEKKSLFFYNISNNILSVINHNSIQDRDSDRVSINSFTSPQLIEYDQIIGIEFIISSFSSITIVPIITPFIVKVSSIDFT